MFDKLGMIVLVPSAAFVAREREEHTAAFGCCKPLSGYWLANR